MRDYMNRISLTARGYLQSATAYVPSRPLLAVVVTGVALAALALIAKWALSTQQRRTAEPRRFDEPIDALSDPRIADWVAESAIKLPSHVLENAKFLNKLFEEAGRNKETFSTLLMTESFNYKNPLGNYATTAPLIHGGRVNAAAIHDKKLGEFPIGAIINVGGAVADVSQGILVTTFEIPDCDETHTFPCGEVADAIDRAVKAQPTGTYVFVNCVEGRSRSTAAIIAYLIKYKKMSYEDALAQVQKCRGGIRFSNPQFEAQLKQFHSTLV
jgi:hypothetical protein